MIIALIGATGMIGSRILDEALARGHHVTAIVRNPDRVPVRPHVTALAGDATDAASIAATASASDIVISAYSPGDGPPENLSNNVTALLEGLAKAGVGRLIVVSGAGSLEVAPGELLVNAPNFPAIYKDRSLAQMKSLDLLRASDGTVAWTAVSPAAVIAPGTRTGTFRVGGDALMTDANGKSEISAEDFAIAVLDEAERNTAPNRRISVAY